MIRSYNGFARRDCKHWSKATNDYEKRKRFGHIIRGYVYAHLLMDGKFEFNNANDEFKKRLSEFNEITLNEIKIFISALDVQRKLLNEMFENKTLGLAKMMDVKHGKNIEALFSLLQSTTRFKEKQHYLKDFNMDIFINAFENWVEYD
jgi:hypothetical protein